MEISTGVIRGEYSTSISPSLNSPGEGGGRDGKKKGILEVTGQMDMKKCNYCENFVFQLLHVASTSPSELQLCYTQGRGRTPCDAWHFLCI